MDSRFSTRSAFVLLLVGAPKLNLGRLFQFRWLDQGPNRAPYHCLQMKPKIEFQMLSSEFPYSEDAYCTATYPESRP
jgi:hypothetical protein